jgi:SNF2 family DNA or RNA helicase
MQLRDRTNHLIIRRTKKEVLPFLPDKYYRRTLLGMQPDQRKLYKQMEDELQVLLDTGEPLWSTSVLSTLTRLRQINLDPKILGITASSAKTDYIVDLIESTNEKIVIFSTFEKYIFLLSLMYPNESITITGEVPVDERAKRVKRFQEDPSIKLCLGTIQTMGEGVTLTAASNVVLADRWWNEPTNQQAIDRLHRIGQKEAVQVLFQICEDSVDETLDAILARKGDSSQEYMQENQVRSMIIDDRRRKSVRGNYMRKILRVGYSIFKVILLYPSLAALILLLIPVWGPIWLIIETVLEVQRDLRRSL